MKKQWSRNICLVQHLQTTSKKCKESRRKRGHCLQTPELHLAEHGHPESMDMFLMFFHLAKLGNWRSMKSVRGWKCLESFLLAYLSLSFWMYKSRSKLLRFLVDSVRSFAAQGLLISAKRYCHRVLPPLPDGFGSSLVHGQLIHLGKLQYFTYIVRPHICGWFRYIPIYSDDSPIKTI